ncbi:MAG: hypothetical protein RBR02_10630 [Desulfuromonadaceae bacterium]|nr:hypothetical protein [Desulfuromonadaceae bacterium]
MKDLSIIMVGYTKEDGNFHYDYKHKVVWTDLEISNNTFQTNIPCTTINKDGTIKERKYLKITTKELIYEELTSLLISIYYIKKDKSDLKYKDKIKLKELKALKTYYEKYIDKQNLITLTYTKETAKKMEELNKINYINKDFNKELVSSVYDNILSDINSQINRIERKKKKFRIKQTERYTFNKITNLLKQDYEKQKEDFILKEKELKEKIKEFEILFKDNSQLKLDLQTLKRKQQRINLNNFREKAAFFLLENGITINTKH